MTFTQKLNSIIQRNNSLLCLGLDPDLKKIPSLLQKTKQPLFKFNKAVIEATHDLVCAYKPNSAFYEAFGNQGILQLKMTCDYIKQNYPRIPIILDFKRGDISYTNISYANFAFSYLKVDAVTVQPYLGQEAVQPFLDYKSKGIIILCRTSNPGASEFQDLEFNGKKLSFIIAENVIKNWNRNANCLLVVGATYFWELARIRKLDDNMFILVPGIGFQGGDLQTTLKAGLNSQKSGLIISLSRSILYVSTNEDFMQKVRKQAKKIRDQINIIRDYER